MKKLYYSALIYMILGLVGGVYYRELTKANEFAGDTELAVVHTHLLVLGMSFFLIVLLLERTLRLSASALFNWFFWLYTAGLVWTVAMMVTIGTKTVLGESTGAALAGMSGLGHILLTVSLVLFFLCLHSRLFSPQQPHNIRKSPGAA